MVLLDLPFRRIKSRFVPEPLPPAGTFKTQTVLVTGGTAGLGLAGALHFAQLGADVIITCRAKSRGDSAKAAIQESAPGARVSVMELDMAQYSSCLAFAAELRKVREGQGGIDVAVFNAGMLTPHFDLSPEGWEMTIQVNTLSTTLLGMLVLDAMKEERVNRSSSANIVFVTSRDHLYPNIRHWKEWSEKEGLLHRFSDERLWPAPWKLEEPNYANSKLLVMYAIEEICKRALGPDGEPQVIVNSVCPGMVKTDIGRHVADQTCLMKALVWVYLSISGKPPDYGARHYVKAAVRPKEEHGQFSIAWLTHEQYLKWVMHHSPWLRPELLKSYTRKARINITNENARMVQIMAWKEIIGELSVKVPGLERHWVQDL